MNKDLDNLKLLSIFHYVVAGLVALFACFPIIHLMMGIMFLTGSFPDQPHQANQPDFPVKLFGLAFTIIPLLIILGGWTLAICTFIAGRKLAKQQSYIFCMVIAGILCMFTPFGTVLGVFTIIVLMRPSVKELFNGRNFSQYNSPPSNWR